MIFKVGKVLATAILFCPGECNRHSIKVPSIPKDSNPIPNDLQSISIEFAYFPDYAGNKSHPNTFSKNLLGNLKAITGVAPKVRVAGTSQYVFKDTV
jgi:hypothetical protein